MAWLDCLNFLLVTLGFGLSGMAFAFVFCFLGYEACKKLRMWYYRMKYSKKTNSAAMIQYKKEFLRRIKIGIEQQEYRHLKTLGMR